MVLSERGERDGVLARQLNAIRQCLQEGRKGPALSGFDMAIEGLYQHTDFHTMGRKFYSPDKAQLKSDQEDKLRKLGVTI